MNHLSHIEGKIEALGQTEYNQNYTLYAYIRFIDKNGNIRMVKNIQVPNTVNSYMSPGAEGRFYISKVESRLNVMFAFESGERKVYDRAEISSIKRSYRVLGYLWLFFVFPVSLLMVVVVIGIIFAPIALFVSYYLLVAKAGKLRESKLEKYLNQEGFSPIHA